MNMPPLNASPDVWGKFLRELSGEHIMAVWSWAVEHGHGMQAHCCIMVLGYRKLAETLHLKCAREEMDCSGGHHSAE